MTALNCIEEYLQGDHRTQTCTSEAEFYTLWREKRLCAVAPAASAIVGALIADRLPWVFTAGYQATLRNAFPSLPRDGWAAFVATEDAHAPQEHPGTVLREDGDGYRLSGYKSWVAHSRCVDHLIVSVNDPGGDKYRAQAVIVPSSADGVHLSHRTQASFLAAMSQGFAHFDNIPVARDAVLAFEPLRQFGRTEAKYVMLSCTTFMIAHVPSPASLRDRLIAMAAALLSLLAETETSRQVYAALDREYQACVADFDAQVDTHRIPAYDADKRLFHMYTARIQRRGEYAKASAAERSA